MMPRSNGIYSLPSGSAAVPNTEIESAPYNNVNNDLANDANDPRPIIAGGTEASSAPDARINLEVATPTIDVTNAESPYSVVVAERGSLFLIDATVGDVTLNLPAAASVDTEFTVSFKRVDDTLAGFAVTLDTNLAETIDGETSITLELQYDSVTLHTDTFNWFKQSEVLPRAAVGGPTRAIDNDDSVYQVMPADQSTLFLMDTSIGNVRAKLPFSNSVDSDYTVSFKRVDDSMTGNNVEIFTTTTDTIDGQTEIFLTTQYEAVTVHVNTAGDWYIESTAIGSGVDGDLFYANASAVEALPIGAEGEVLTAQSGLPAWAPPPPAIIGTQGFDASGTWNRPAGCTTVRVWITGGGQARSGSASGGTAGVGISVLDVTNIASADIVIGAGATGSLAALGGDSTWDDMTNTVTGNGGGTPQAGGQINLIGTSLSGTFSQNSYWGSYGQGGDFTGASDGNDGFALIEEFA